MYIFEIIAKFLKDRKVKKISMQYEIDPEEDDFESCEHIYVAIDSTKDYFACTKCGHVIKNTQTSEKINFFKI
jgi:PHP family Zn ribbon phosphoesterase